MRTIIFFAFLAVSVFGQTGPVLKRALDLCEVNTTPETCTGTGEDGRPCLWCSNDEGKCKSETCENESSDQGCENYDSTTCNTQNGQNAYPCFYSSEEEQCKESNCEHYTSTETCSAGVGEHGETCNWNTDENKCIEADEGAAEGAEASCENFTEETDCGSNTGENGDSCVWDASEYQCKEADCEVYATSETCTGKTGENGATCSWTDTDGCKPDSEIEAPEAAEIDDTCKGYNETTCSTQTGEHGLTCYWHLNDGECEESDSGTILRKMHQTTPVNPEDETAEDAADAADEAAEDTAEGEAVEPDEVGEAAQEAAEEAADGELVSEADEDAADEADDAAEDAAEGEAPEIDLKLRKTHQTSTKDTTNWTAVVGVAGLVLGFVSTAYVMNTKSQRLEAIDMEYDTHYVAAPEV